MRTFQLLAQPREREGAVPVMAALVARHDADASREVGEPDAALGHVLMLAAGATGTERLHGALREKRVVVVGYSSFWGLGLG